MCTLKKMNKSIQGFLFVLPSLVGVMLFYILPFAWSFLYSFTKGINKRRWVGGTNFKILFQNEAYRLALKNTAYILGIAIPLILCLALCIAFFLEHTVTIKSWILVILLIPLVLPSASMNLLWKDLLSEQGILSSLFQRPINWLEGSLGQHIIICLILWKNVGYATVLILATLLHFPAEYEEMAKIEGASSFSIILKIKIPYLYPVLFFNFIIAIINSLKIFREVYLLQGTYPSEALYMLQHFMNNHFVNLNYQMLTSAAFVLYGFIFVVLYAIERWQRHSEN